MTKILVVDDIDELRDDLEDMVGREKGREVFSASSAKQAIEIIQKQNIDLVITDLLMEAETAGLDVLKAAKEKDVLTQVILVTGHQKTEIGVQAMRMGAYDFIERNTPSINYLIMLQEKIPLALEFRGLKKSERNKK